MESENRSKQARALAAVFVLCLATILAACGGNSSPVTPPPATARLVSIAVTPSSASIPVNTTQQFTATGTYSDSSMKNLTAQVTWSTNNSTIATVNASGLATGIASDGRQHAEPGGSYLEFVRSEHRDD